jgi:uncharacterized phage protein (TIGR02218 family)
MTLAASPALVSFLANNRTATPVELYRIGAFRWTSAPVDLVVAGVTYYAAGGPNAPVINRGQYQRNNGTVIDTFDITLSGTHQEGGFTLSNLAYRGALDGLSVEIDLLFCPQPGDTSLGPISNYFKGQVSTPEPRGLETILHCKSLMELLAVKLPHNRIQSQCNHVLYDAGCTLPRGAFTFSGTVQSATGQALVATVGSAVAGQVDKYFALGVITFTSGTLLGEKVNVSAWTQSTRTFVLGSGLTGAPAPGDTFTAYAGCDRARATCLTKFANLANFNGYPDVPTSAGGSL